MRFKIYMLFPFFVLGILSFNLDLGWVRPLYLIIISIVICSFLYLFWRNTIWIFICVFYIIGGSFLLIHKELVYDKYVSIKENRIYEGLIVDLKENSITIKNNDNRYRITFFLPSNKKTPNMELGDYVILKGKLKEKLSYRENNMASRSIDGYGDLRNIECINRKTTIWNIPLKIKNKINKGLLDVDKDAGAFVSGLVTGYRSSITQEDIDRFSELDIVHIIAVSGFNVAIIYAVVMSATKRFPLRKRLKLSILICFLYVIITGFEPSITRALIMIIMVIIGRIINKKYSTINALFVAGFIMLSVNPFYIYNLGFIYSYLATFSIALFNTDIISKVEGYTKLFKDEIGATISSIILTFPIVIYNKGYFSILSLIINVLLGPVISVITILGFITCFIYVIIPFTMVLYPVVFIGEITLGLIRIFSSINILVPFGQPSVLFIICYYVFILSIFNIIQYKKVFNKCIVLVILLSVVLLQGVINYNIVKIHFINVGQGDSIFIELPGRKNMLIDTGDAYEDYVVAESKIDPYLKRLGYKHINYLVISHFHDDHVGGVEFLESKYPIYNKISYEGCADKTYLGIKKGDVLSISGVDFKVLSPKGYVNKDDENKNSLILELKYKKFTALFTGDGTKGEMDNIKGEYDVVKIPHHGSKYSVSENMMKNSRIKTAVIMVGTNSFGHPSKECIDSLESKNINVYRTDKSGNIVVTINSKGYKVNLNN